MAGDSRCCKKQNMLTDLDHRLRTLELKCRFPVKHLLAGEYHSIFKGRGVEFEDVRPYEPGDDVRTMEWKVTARTGTPHIKRYIEEREQFIYLVVDISASVLEDGNGKRRDTITEVCGMITMAALNNNDRVGLILFTDELELVISPAKGRQHALRIMEALLTFQPRRKGTRFEAALDAIGHLARKRSVFFIISDFLADDHLDEMAALATRHDVNAIHLIDPRYALSQCEGLLRIQDSESGVESLVDLKLSRNEKGLHKKALRTSMMNHGVNLMEIEAGQDCVSALATFFKSRQHRIDEETGG